MARSSRAVSGIRSLRRGLKDLDFKGQTNRKLEEGWNEWACSAFLRKAKWN